MPRSLLWSTPAAAALVKNVRTWSAPDHTRVVFDLDSSAAYKVFLLDGPDRVVIDMKHTRLATDIRRPSRSDRLIRGIRSAPRKNGGLRVVLDLKRPIRPRSFLLDPNKQYGHRLVVDLYPKNTNTRDEVVENQSAHRAPDGAARCRGRGGPWSRGETIPARRLAGESMRRMWCSRYRGSSRGSLTPGKGCARSSFATATTTWACAGARNSRGRREPTSSSRCMPTPLGTRVSTAPPCMSISRRGASSEAARWLATQENAADLAGGVSLDDEDEGLATVKLDLAQTGALRASREVGRRVLSRLGRIGPLHKQRVERAGFLVLKAPNIPSILVETGFITNALDERRLMDPAQRRAIAGAIAEGIAGYFEVYPPPETLLAKRRHVIARGDTLSEIADRYRVSLAALRTVNQIRGDRIHIGDVLRIPEG